MRATTYDAVDIKNGRLEKISEEEAYEMIKDRKRVIIRVRSREFILAETLPEFKQMKKLNNDGIYDMFICYNEKTP